MSGDDHNDFRRHVVVPQRRKTGLLAPKQSFTSSAKSAPKQLHGSRKMASNFSPILNGQKRKLDDVCAAQTLESVDRNSLNPDSPAIKRTAPSEGSLLLAKDDDSLFDQNLSDLLAPAEEEDTCNQDTLQLPESEDIFACSDDEDILPRDASTPRVTAQNEHITNQRNINVAGRSPCRTPVNGSHSRTPVRSNKPRTPGRRTPTTKLRNGQTTPSTRSSNRIRNESGQNDEQEQGPSNSTSRGAMTPPQSRRYGAVLNNRGTNKLGNNRPEIELQKTRTTPVQTQKATQKVTPTQGQKGPISQNKGSSGKKENTQALSNSASEESQTMSSLPQSFLDVRARVLLSPALTPVQQRSTQRRGSGWRSANKTHNSDEDSYINEHVVSAKKDRGPFYGLPARVKQLYREQKGIENLFPWQISCLTSQAVQNKENLLYSLPTSGGKTLVAEIIMLQEMLCYRKNCIFVLPYVSLVQEKIRSMSPFALDLGFYLEEYAGTKGRFPPQKRRFKKSLFICTIEKAHALLNSLVSEKRLEEIGLVVIDEVHMIGEDSGRGANLESFITKIKYMNRLAAQDKENTHQGSEKTADAANPTYHKIQMISMSATVGNLREISTFLESELYTDSWRPVQLQEYIKVGRDIHKVQVAEADQFQFLRKIDTEKYTAPMKQADEDFLTSLIMEVYPNHSCLVFCDTKRRCENVSEMLCKVIHALGQAQLVLEYNQEEKETMIETLKQDGSGFMCPKLARTLRYGIAYHHSGLTMDERKVIEEGFLSGAIGVLCCTSTLAAGVNLPARRVIIRSPFMGRNQLTHTQYKQMVGRAGRAGLDTHGESFLMVKSNQVKLVEDVVTSPVEHCMTSLHLSGNSGVANLILNCMSLGLVNTPSDAKDILDMTLMNTQAKKLNINISEALQSSLDLLLRDGLVILADTGGSTQEATQQTCGLDTRLKPSRIGRAAIQGNIQLSLAGQLYEDLKNARPHLAVDTSLHLLYLITPYDLTQNVYYSASIYYKICMGLNESELQVGRFLGITEAVLTGLMTGRSVTKAMKPVLSRFYLALVLLDLWNSKPIHEVAEKFDRSRGEVQNLMTSAASFANSVLYFCLEIEEFWAYQELLEPFVKRLAHCCSPELLPLLELPGVKAGRGRQLLAAGFTNIQAIARADTKDLVARVEHLSMKAATAIVQSAQLILIDKAEALHDEADILLDLKS